MPRQTVPIGDYPVPGEQGAEVGMMEITDRDWARMNNKLFQLWRFLVLNLRILKAVTHSKWT